MGSRYLEVSRQGFWAAFTGGWFFDPHHGIFCNTFHLYLWLFLLCFPFTIYLTVPFSFLAWALYTCGIAAVFVFIKLINWRLHHMYDTTECFEENGDSNDSWESGKMEEDSKTSETATSKLPTQGETSEGIEMAPLSSSSQRSRCPSLTPPVQCSSRNSTIESQHGVMIDSNELAAHDSSPTPVTADTTEAVATTGAAAHSTNYSVTTTIETVIDAPSLVRLDESKSSTQCLDTDSVATNFETTTSIKSMSSQDTEMSHLDDAAKKLMSRRVSEHSNDSTLINYIPSAAPAALSGLLATVNSNPGCSTMSPQSSTSILGSGGRDNMSPVCSGSSSCGSNRTKKPSKTIRRSKSALDSESSRQSSLTVLDPREPQNAGPEFFFQAGGRYPSGGSEKGSCKSGIQPHFALGESQNYPCSASKCLESCDCRGDVKSSSRGKKKQSRYSKSNPEVILHEYSSSPQMSVKDKKRSQSSKSSNSTNNALNSSVKHSRHDSGNSLILSKSRHDSGKSNISYTAHSVEGFRLCTDSSDEEKLVEEELGHSLHPISHTGTNNNDATLSPTTQDSMQLDPSLAGQNQCCASSKSDGHCDDGYGDVDVINKRAALPGTDVGQEDYTHGSYALPVFLWNTKEANKLSRVQATKSGTGRGTGSVGVEGGGAGAGSGHCSTASQPHSHKSSVVGLDWLFSTTDSDSSRSVSPCDSINSTSTLSGEDSTYDDTSPDQHPSYRVAAGMKRHHTSGSSSSISSSHSSNSSINSTRMPSVSMLSPHIPGSSNESPEQMLSRQRSQGAIPKHRHTPYRVGSAGRTVPRSLKHHKNSTSTSSSMPKHHSFSDSRSITDKDYQDDIEYHFSKKVLDILDRAKDMDNFEQEFHKLKKSLVEMKMIGAVDQERPSRRMLFKDRDNDQAWRRRRIRRRRGMTANGGGGGGSGGSSAPATQESVDSANHDGDTADAMPSTSSAASDPHKHHPTHAASLPLSSSRESYCSNHTEASALLPSYCSPGHRNLPSSQHPLNNRFGDGMDSSHSVENLDSSRPPEKVMAALLAKAEGNHLALSHDDTSQGAMHWFQDRSGKWFAYTFGENSTGLAEGLSEPKKYKDKWVDGGSSSDSSSTAVISSTNVVSSNPRLDMLDLSLPSSVINNIINRTSVPSDNSQDKEKKPKNYYKFTLLPAVKHYRVYFDRLALLALLDRNTVMETFMCILLAVGVSVLGALLLSKQFYNDFWIFSFCFTMASSQYSLLKSTQPDSASPMHGYNRIITFSRPFYFCLCASLVLVLDYAANNWSKSNVVLYTLPISTLDALVFARTLLVIFLLSFPVIFLFGLLPQVNTFCMFVLEQAEIHVFGGNATTSLTAAAFTVMRSCVAVAVLYGFCYAGLQEAESSQHIVFSIYCGICIPVCYHLSRSSSCASVIWSLVTDKLWPVTKRRSSESDVELIDPLPTKLKQAVYDRLRNDLIVMCCTAVFVFAVHVSTAFSSPVLQPMLFDVLVYISAGLGILLHYIIPQLRKEMPWLCCSHPILPNRERDQFEVKEAAHVTIFEICYVWLRFFERNIVYSVVFMSALTTSARQLVEEEKFSLPVITLIVVICSMKMMRSAFNATQHQYLIILFTFFFFKYDFQNTSETFLVDYFFMSIVYHKFYELILKVRFVITYIAPWQITWGSAFHAFAQPLSVPHSAILFFQTFVSAVFSTPLNPVLGSALFIISYVRPTKFWERDYNTRRVDNTNTRLSSQLERNPGADDNNLNSIFYEHLTRSLQHSLCGDLMLGRWGNVKQGDCFIIASDYLNALVHIIEMGNGLVTFQLRGLEFRGTYCQQREVEAITEGLEEDEAFCCCEPGHLPHCLSVNAAFNQRWLAWQVIVTKYVIEGYSISDNSAASMLQVYDLRKVLLTYYVKSIIYYTVRSPKLEHWLNNQVIREGLKDTLDKSYVDLDPTFSMNVDEDYDLRLAGVSKSSFCLTYLEWIQYCASRREKNTIDSDRDSWLVSLCFGLSLLGRRTLGSASHNNASASVDFFLYGLHALFKGDFRITSPRDEWVFSDMELLRRVVAPGIRMSLKLHQDHFTFPDEYDNNSALYEAISSHENSMVISHENDPSWRNAVLSNVPSLLALRHVLDEGSDEYKIIMLNKRYLSFRVIKVNRECVRGLWAGQQQELVFLRNRDPERGSIQNAKQALRNMINSSCDQPIGYPIYVSPLTTSYSGTNNQLSAVLGKEFTLNGVIKAVRNMWTRLRLHCGATCASGSAGLEDYNMGCNPHFTSGMTPCTGGAGGNLCHPGGGGTLSSGAGSGGGGAVLLSGITDPHQLGATRGSTVSSVSSISKPSSALVSIAGLTTDKDTPTPTPTTQSLTPYKVQIVDPSCVYDNVNLGRRIDVQWPNDEWRMKGGKNNWGGWTVERGATGVVVHRWQPCHREIGKRSHVDRTIVLVQIGDRYVPIAEAGVITLDANPSSAHAATPTGGVGGGDSGGFTGSVTADV